jgi:hypothetical protein
VAVKGIPVFRKSALFAECRWNEGLGRSVSVWRFPPLHASAPATADVRRTPRRGTSSSTSLQCVGTRFMHFGAGVSGTRPSLGPQARARRSSLCTAGAIPGGGALEVASRLGKLAQAGGTSTGVITNGRSAARRVSPLPQGRGRGTKEKDGGRGLPPCEDARARVWLPARRS